MSEPVAKKAKTDAPHMNIDDIVDKAYEGKTQRKTFTEIADAPISALQGLADWTDDVGKKLHIPTIKKLGQWKYFLWSRAFVTLSKYEIPDHRVAGSLLNCNKALDKDHEGKTIKEILALPPSALSGIAEHSDADLAKFKVKTIEDLGTWKFALAANSIATLAEMESADINVH
ncbi:hypothetical protein JL720_11044 [Aureococcus anophagefferens]|nr:hypothetical protein JL720_11044 [Aureococcus anophagefferens]